MNQKNLMEGLRRTPRISDGSFYFLQHLIHKMEPKVQELELFLMVHLLFTGDAGSGESEIRKWIIENDLLETVIMLPDKLFFNTHIATYIWILDNKKNKNQKKVKYR